VLAPNGIRKRNNHCFFQPTKESVQAGHCTRLPTALAGMRNRLRQWGQGTTAGPEARTLGAETGRPVRTEVSTACALSSGLPGGALACSSAAATLAGAVRRQRSKTPPRQTRTTTIMPPESGRGGPRIGLLRDRGWQSGGPGAEAASRPVATSGPGAVCGGVGHGPRDWHRWGQHRGGAGLAHRQGRGPVHRAGSSRRHHRGPRTGDRLT
jgi:hypothetical protein